MISRCIFQLILETKAVCTMAKTFSQEVWERTFLFTGWIYGRESRWLDKEENKT